MKEKKKSPEKKAIEKVAETISEQAFGKEETIKKIKEDRKILLTVNVPLVVGYGIQEWTVPESYTSAELAVEETVSFCDPNTSKVFCTLKVLGKKRAKPLEILVDFPK